MMDASLFVSAEVREKKVRLANGAEHVLYFKDLTQAAFSAWQNARKSAEGEDETIRASAEMVAQCLCEKDGTPALTVDDALRLKPAVMLAIRTAILELNEFVEGKALPPEVKSGSGTPSPSPLAAVR